MAVSVTSGTLLVINVNFFFAIKSTDPALYYTLTYFSVLFLASKLIPDFVQQLWEKNCKALLDCHCDITVGVSNSCTDNNTIAFCDIITVEFISQSHVASFPGPRRRRKGLISAVHAYAKLSILCKGGGIPPQLSSCTNLSPPSLWAKIPPGFLTTFLPCKSRANTWKRKPAYHNYACRNSSFHQWFLYWTKLKKYHKMYIPYMYDDHSTHTYYSRCTSKQGHPFVYTVFYGRRDYQSRSMQQITLQGIIENF